MPNLKRLIITVPAGKELWSNYDQFYGHYCRFERADLRQLLTECGLETLELRHLFGSLYPFLWLTLRLHRKRDVHFQAPRRWIAHRIAEKLLVAEHRLKITRRFGTTLLAVAALK